MADKPILFSAPMVRALLAGTKTQTRRSLRSIDGHRAITEFGHSDTPGYDWHFRDIGMRWCDVRHDNLISRLRLKHGDRLWVKETYRINSWSDDGDVWIIYAADDTRSRSLIPDNEDFLERLCARVEKAGAELNAEGWYENIPPAALVRPSIFMPRWASRITLTVTDVRVQRLHDISEADALAEGVKPWPTAMFDAGFCQVDSDQVPARTLYAALWDHLNGSGAWQTNPWVAAYTFTVALGNIDSQPGGDRNG